MTYRGKYSLRNPSKYRGDKTNVIFRSLWERNLFRWLDEQSNVVSWSSEETIIPYRCKTDGRVHRYFVDVKMTFKDGRTLLVEVKPHKETQPPKNPGRKTKRYITEVLTYAKNYSKWAAADEYAKDRGWQFQIWTENELRKLGVFVL